jgi:TonB-linked SusC/RagA family outer membrane protein
MRKIASLLAVLMLFYAFAFAQNTRIVTGQVKNDKGDPIPFATVSETGTQNATTADINGNFKLTVKTGSQITVSATGHNPVTLTPGTGLVSPVLTVRSGEMSEVVVTTAFGVRRAQRTTPYSAQVLTNEQIQIIPHTNVNDALAGKIVGAQFRAQSPMKLNDQTSIRLRGGLTLSDRGPLYIVDGTAVNSFDLSPEDIEDITVLKGANATALFGTEARGGAIVITTRKKGKAGTNGIEVNQSVVFDRVYVLPNYQNLYAGGSTYDLIKFTWGAGMPDEWKPLDGKYFPDYTDDASWGPRMVGQEYVPWYSWVPGTKYTGTTAKLVPQPDNARDFYETGLTTITNVSFSKSGQGYNARVSYTNNMIKGMLPNTSQEKHNLFATVTLNLNDHFTIGTDVNFINNKTKGVGINSGDDGYANQSSGSFNQWYHRDLDMGILKELRALKTPIGTFPSWNLSLNPDAGDATRAWKGNYWYNYYAWFDNFNNKNNRDRLFGDVYLTYTLNNNFKIKGTVRKNELTTNYENITPSILEASATQTGIFASYATGVTRSDIMNYELLATYSNKFFTKLDFNLNAGGNWNKTRYSDVSAATVNGLNVPDFYAIANSKNQPSIGNTRQRQETRSLFAFGDLEWNRMFDVNFAIRNDWYSTNPKGNDLFSPSVGASFFFTDLTKNALPWLTFGKIFGSWGKKPNPLELFANNFLYGVNQNQWNGNILMSTPDRLINAGVTGSLITTYEAGFEIRALKNRISLNALYYNETNQNEPLAVATGGSGGFSSELINALRIERKGVEIQLSGRPIVRNNFTWEIIKNFAWLLNNKVSDFPQGQDQLLLAGGAFGTRFARAFQEKGQDWGQLIGGGIARTTDGLPLLDADGLYVRDIDAGAPATHYGSIVPKVTGGIINTFNYKNFIFNFNIDYQVGGEFFSLSEQWGNYSGLLKATAATNDKGWNVRDNVADGGGVHVVGISVVDQRTPVDMYVDAQTYFHQFYNAQIAEPYVHSLTFVKLREVSLGYQIPVQKWKIGKVFKGATATIVARNPWLIYRETDSFDPSEISAVQGEDGQYPGTRSLGFNLKFNF